MNKKFHVGNIPPLSEKRIKEIVAMVYDKKTDDNAFPFELSDEEILTLVKRFLSMRAWVKEGKFPLLCYKCGKPLNFVAFTYEGENFLFWHCYDCHIEPYFEQQEEYITFEDFKDFLSELKAQRMLKIEK